jgi:hypothetical protein
MWCSDSGVSEDLKSYGVWCHVGWMVFDVLRIGNYWVKDAKSHSKDLAFWRPKCNEHSFSFWSFLTSCHFLAFSIKISLCVKTQVSHPYRTAGKILMLQILIFILFPLLRSAALQTGGGGGVWCILCTKWIKWPHYHWRSVHSSFFSRNNALDFSKIQNLCFTLKTCWVKLMVFYASLNINIQGTLNKTMKVGVMLLSVAHLFQCSIIPYICIYGLYKSWRRRFSDILYIATKESAVCSMIGSCHKLCKSLA